MLRQCSLALCLTVRLHKDIESLLVQMLYITIVDQKSFQCRYWDLLRMIWSFHKDNIYNYIKFIESTINKMLGNYSSQILHDWVADQGWIFF